MAKEKITAPAWLSPEAQAEYIRNAEKRRDQGKTTRSEDRNLRRHGAKQATYGGITDEEYETAKEDGLLQQDDILQREAREDVARSRARESAEYEKIGKARDTARARSEGATAERKISARDTYRALDNLESSVTGNKIGKGTENALSQRAGELAAKPTIGQATETAIGANQQNARDQLAQQVGMMNRQSRGLAGSMGEGGALAMQQAVASAGANAADLAAQNQLQQNQLNAGMRFNAGVQQRAEDVAGSNLGLQARLGATAQQMGAEQALAQQRAGVQQLNTGYMLNAADQYNQLAGGLYGQTLQGMMGQQANQLNVNNSIYNAQQAANNAKYENAKGHNPLQTGISTAFDPADLRGSGSKGLQSGNSYF